MSLFVCEECRTVENTALSRFWTRKHTTEGRALCSGCDPETTWHGRFPRRTYDPERDTVQWVDGAWIAANESEDQ